MSRWRHFTIGALLAIGSSGAGAAVYNQYPFDAAEDYLAPAAAFSGWAEALHKHAEQQAKIDACAADKKACRGRLGSYTRMLAKAETLTRDEQISLAHFYINRTEYDDDRSKRLYDHEGNKIGVRRNHFATLYDFLVKGGDCEDYASAKYFMLRGLGFAAEDMRVVITYEKKLRGYHAVLAIRRDDGEVWLLDSDNLIRKRSHRGYRYVYAMNEHSVWDHRDDYEGGVQEETGVKVVPTAVKSGDTQTLVSEQARR